MNGFEVILPFLRPIESLMLNPDISEIMVNGSERIFIERAGFVEVVPGLSLTEKSLMIAVKNIARRLGSDISEATPILDSRLPDGSRVAAVIPPCSVKGVTLTIRKFNARHFTIEDLIEIGTLPQACADFLKQAVLDRKNILIGGGTGSGKTTLLNILAGFISNEERLVLIEDTAEVQLRKDNLVRFEARREQDGVPAVTIRELLKATLRHGPTGSSWEKFGAARRSTCFNCSTPGIPVRSRPFIPRPLLRDWRALRAASYRAASSSRTAPSRPTSPIR